MSLILRWLSRYELLQAMGGIQILHPLGRISLELEVASFELGAAPSPARRGSLDLVLQRPYRARGVGGRSHTPGVAGTTHCCRIGRVNQIDYHRTTLRSPRMLLR